MIDDIVTAEEARNISLFKGNYVLKRIKIAMLEGRLKETFNSTDQQTNQILLKKGYKVEEKEYEDDPTDPIPSFGTYILVSW
jgi:predicted AAA+ superfamily ATPase